MTSCKPKKATVTPVISVGSDIKKELTSDFVINYFLDKKTIRDTFQNTLHELFKEPIEIPDQDIKVLLEMAAQSDIEIEGKRLLTVLPIKVQLLKKTFISTIKANGVIEITLITDVDVMKNWHMVTKTQLSKHRWIESPKLSIGGINLPISFISDEIIKRYKKNLVESIDEAIKDNFSLKKNMQDIMLVLQNPLQVNDAPQVWMNVHIDQVKLSQFLNTKLYTGGKLHLRTTNTFSTQKPANSAMKKPLPAVYWDESIPDSSTFRAIVNIEINDILPLIKQNFEGRTFQEGRRNVTFSNIDVKSNYDLITVTALASGDLEGLLQLSGIPKYDISNNKIYFDNVDVRIKSKNVFIKAASWILKGNINKEISKAMSFPISEAVKDIQSQLDNQIKIINETHDLDLNAKIGQIYLDDLKVVPDKIESLVVVKLYLSVGIKDFRKLK